MSLTDQINEDIKNAMRSRDKETLNVLRGIKSKLLLEMTKSGDAEVTEADEMRVLQKLYKQHKDSAQIYKDQGRDDLHAEEMAGANVIEKYLPAQMTEEEIRTKVKAIIEESGASGMQDMGKVMGMASKALSGQADNKVVSAIVKEELSK